MATISESYVFNHNYGYEPCEVRLLASAAREKLLRRKVRRSDAGMLPACAINGQCGKHLRRLPKSCCRISQKAGSIKLCHVGPEIMDIFNATKLGQLFEILDNEQQGSKAFG